MERQDLAWRRKLHAKPLGGAALPPTLSRSVRQALRFTLIGIANNAVGYLLYLVITYYETPPKVAMTLLYCVGVLIGFVGNKTYAFSHKGNAISAGGRYLAAHACGYLVALTIQITMVDQLGFPHQLAQAVAVIVVAMFLFVVFKYFVFTNTATDTRAKNL